MNVTSSTIAAHNSVKYFLRNETAYFDQEQCRVMEIFAGDFEKEMHIVSPGNEIGLHYVYRGNFPTTQ
jgi:hypothetical protein